MRKTGAIDRIVGSNLRAAREAAALTPDDLARDCGIDVHRLTAIEDGRIRPTVDELVYLSLRLRVGVAALFTDPSDPISGGNQRGRGTGTP